jgi:hypothetical protein
LGCKEEKGICGEVWEGDPTKVLFNFKICDLAHDNYEFMTWNGM